MTTPLDIITAALKDSGVLGVGQTASAEDTQDAFQKLNWMLAQWNRKRYLVYHLVDLVCKATTGKQSYTVGPGGDFDIAIRPDRIDAAFLRQATQGSLVANEPQTALPVPMTGSPFVFIVPFNGSISINQTTLGDVSAVYISSQGSEWYPVTNHRSPIQVGAGNLVEIVYTVAPTVTFLPINTGIFQSGEPSMITPTGTTYTFIAPTSGSMILNGGNVLTRSVSVDGGVTFFATSGFYGPMPTAPGTQIRMTYSSPPTITFIPLTVESVDTNQAVVPPYAVDYPLAILESRIDYNRIGLKNLDSPAYQIFYDPQAPYGVLWPYPAPVGSNFEIHLTVKCILGAFKSLGQEIQLPEEYMGALHYNLITRLVPAYQLQQRPDVVGLAKDSLAVLRRANTQVPRKTMPSEVLGRGMYNIYSDRSR